MIDVREVIKRKISNLNKKGFLIDIDDYELKITKHGFIVKIIMVIYLKIIIIIIIDIVIFNQYIP